MFGYDLDSRFDDYYWVDVSLGYDYRLPRIDRMMATTVKAMNNKRHAERYIQQMDETWQKALDWPTLPWSEIKKISDKDHLNYGSLPSWFCMRLTAEVMLNLDRAALEYRHQPQSAVIAQTADFIKDPENPWRDPFTEKALMVNRTTTQTLIYSLGPELKDHKGLVPYQTDSIGGLGNIVIRVPFR